MSVQNAYWFLFPTFHQMQTVYVGNFITQSLINTNLKISKLDILA